MSILAIAKISATDNGFAEQLLQAWTPERFALAQAQCIREMLQLNADDLLATIVDALEPCGLRRRVRSQQEGEPASGLETQVCEWHTAPAAWSLSCRPPP